MHGLTSQLFSCTSCHIITRNEARAYKMLAYNILVTPKRTAIQPFTLRLTVLSNKKLALKHFIQ